MTTDEAIRNDIYISGFRVVYVVILYVSKYLVPCCGVRCDFRV